MDYRFSKSFTKRIGLKEVERAIQYHAECQGQSQEQGDLNTQVKAVPEHHWRWGWLVYS